MIFSSKWVKDLRSDRELFEYIGDMNNMPPILPEQVVNISSDADNLSFTIQGMGSIALRVFNRKPNELIQLSPVGKTPFQFVLNIYIRNYESASECCFEIDAQLNPLMQMMASRPLQNLVNMMAERFNN
ncbi:MAG: hypothetical protein E7066_04920 [Lentimicrobiaceae bacterium]|nr:hypothetical protein [Lentimicrobiaceae bacterium]